MAAHEAKAHHKHHKQHEQHARHHEHHGVRAEHPLSGEYFAQERFMNASNAKSPVASFDWMNRIHFSGMINVDGKFSNRSPLGTVPLFRHHAHNNASEINVNNANLFVDVDVNHCVTGHVGFAYVADSVNLFDLGVNTNEGYVPFTDSIRSDKGAVWANGSVGVDEAYITIRDFAQTPFYFRAGKEYIPFGYNQEIYPITESLSQLLTQTRATAAQLGYVSNYGMYGSLYVLNGARSSFRHSNNTDGNANLRSYTTLENWGGQIGYATIYSDVRYNVNASYINDLRDGDFLSTLEDLARFNADNTFGNVSHLHSVGGAAFHGDATFGPYSLVANYVAALENIDGHHHRDLTRERHHHDSRLGAADLTGTFNSNVLGYNTDFSLGYQRSWEAETTLLPRWRYQGDISVCVLPHTTLALEYHYDRAYGAQHHEGQSSGVAPIFVDDSVARQGNEGGHHHHQNDHRSTGTAALRLGVVF
jgi:hypothetical protein